MKKILLLLIFLLMISGIYAKCNETQIDINSALAEELKGLDGIGPVKAEEIINSRPFKSVDDLINVWGIGEKTLNKIIDQGLACVDEETEEEVDEETPEEPEEPNEEEEQEEENKEEEESEEKVEIEETKDIQKTPIQPSIIKLNSKDIKTEDNKEESTKSEYAKYGFVVFCILLGFLFILKKRKTYKTEFEENENKEE